MHCRNKAIFLGAWRRRKLPRSAVSNPQEAAAALAALPEVGQPQQGVGLEEALKQKMVDWGPLLRLELERPPSSSRHPRAVVVVVLP